MTSPGSAAEKRVLVVDDEVTVLRLLEKLLTSHGYVVDAVEKGRAAIECMRGCQYGVAIVDKNLPDLSGLDILAEASTLAPRLRIIIFTAYASQESSIEALRRGAHDYIPKPIDLDLLVEKVNRAWEVYQIAEDHEQLFRRYETLFEMVPGIVWFMTEDGVLTRINQEGAAVLGYEPEDLLGSSYRVLLPPSESPQDTHWAFNEPRPAPRGPRRQVLHLKTRDGRTKVFEVSATGTFHHSPEGPRERSWGTLGVGWDITDHAQLQEQLEQSRRMEAIGRLAGSIAHDFNNVLVVIENNARFIREDLPRDHPRMEDVLDIEAAAGRAAKLTNQLLTFSRTTVTNREVIDLGEVIDDLQGMLRRLVTERIEIELRRDPDLQLIEADVTQMEQVIINLVANARDAMPEGGRVTVQVSNISLDEAAAAVHLDVKPGQYVMLAVSDTGCGMSAETRQRVFDPFFTTKEEGRGTGVGMATVYSIIKQSAGHITVYSEESIGTSVKAYLPVATGQRVSRVRVPTPPLATGEETILVVEDEDNVRRMVRRILRGHGYRVLEAADGGEALRLANQREEGFEVLLTDMVMPHLGGSELALKLRQQNPRLRIVYMSGYVGNVEQKQVMLREGATFLQKPFSAARLLQAIRGVLDKERA